MYKVMNILFPAVLYLVQGYCLQYFYGNFLESRGKGNRWNRLAVMAVYTMVRVLVSLLEPEEVWNYQVAVGKLIVSLVLLALLAFCFYRAFRLLTVYLIVTFQAVADISRYAAVILFGELGDGMICLWNWCAGKGLFPSEKALGMAVSAGLVCEWILEYLAITLLMYLSLKKIAKDFREKEYEVHRTELLFLITPAAVGMLICLLLRIIIVTMEDGIPKILYDRYPILTILLPAILLLSLLSILQGVKLFQDMVSRNRERSGRIILEKQVAGLQEHMEEMERVYSGIRSMKHDMKNTVFVIQRLSARTEGKENEELKNYLEELNRTFESLELRFKTGNGVVDTILNMKYHEAVREVPDLRMEADGLLFPAVSAIRSYDIGVILGNALDNATEACRRLKDKEPEAEAFVRLSSWQKGNLLILKVENSFDGRPLRKGPGEFPVTDKADRHSHGIGLSNIKNTAEKYHGTMDFRIEGRVFILSVMMKNERREEDGVWRNR